MPKGIRKTASPIAGMFFKGTEEQFGTLMGLAALVNEQGVTLDRVKTALSALKAVEEALGVTAATAAAKKAPAKKTVAKKKPAAKKSAGKNKSAGKKSAAKKKAGWSDERRAKFAKTVAAKKKVKKAPATETATK